MSIRLPAVLAASVLAVAVAASCGEDGPPSPSSLTASPLRITPTPAAPAVAPTPTVTATARPTATPTRRPTPTATRPPTPEPTPTIGPGGLPAMDVEPAFPNLSFERMVHLTYSGPDDKRLFLVLQPGRIVVFDNDRDVETTRTFLDIEDRVNDRGNEEGLLGLAFDPEYDSNGYFYVYYSASGPRRSVISRFSVSAQDPNVADPSSEARIMEVAQPFSNHNGGNVLFGPDGYLYIGLGDGGSGGDPQGNGQDLSTLLGTVLRIDVSTLDRDGAYSVPPDNPFVGRGGGAREEIWAYGLRNPWRFTFDRETGDLWAGDVGQNQFEEVDIIKPGLNYGWNVMEGFHCFGGGLSLRQLLRRGEESCDREGLAPPVIEYGRDGGCSITGGYVYRGSRLPSLIGAYVYGDFCSGKIWALRHDGVQVTEHRLLVDSSLLISAFGEDPSGELYILSFDGKIYRLRPG